MLKISTFSEKRTQGVLLQNRYVDFIHLQKKVQKMHCFLEKKNYTACKKFTRPLVVAVATNLNSLLQIYPNRELVSSEARCRQVEGRRYPQKIFQKYSILRSRSKLVSQGVRCSWRRSVGNLRPPDWTEPSKTLHTVLQIIATLAFKQIPEKGTVQHCFIVQSLHESCILHFIKVGDDH